MAAWLLGSVARGEAREGSGSDLAVFEISLEDGRLVTNTGFGPQHGAKVFERYVFVPAAPE